MCTQIVPVLGYSQQDLRTVVNSLSTQAILLPPLLPLHHLHHVHKERTQVKTRTDMSKNQRLSTDVLPHMSTKRTLTVVLVGYVLLQVCSRS